MSLRLKVSIPSGRATAVRIAGEAVIRAEEGADLAIGSIVGLERDSDEFTIVTIELTDDEAELA